MSRRNTDKKIKKLLTKKYIKIKIGIRVVVFSIIILFILIIFGIIRLLDYLDISINHFKNPSFVIFQICFFCIVLSTIFSSFMIIKVLNPLNQLGKAIQKISKGNYNVKLDYNGKIEEFQDIFKKFNNMTKELNSVEMIRNDFIANVSHEFKTPLSSVTGYITLLQDSELT